MGKGIEAHLNFHLPNFVWWAGCEPFEIFGVLMLPNEKIFMTHGDPAEAAEFENGVHHPSDGARKTS